MWYGKHTRVKCNAANTVFNGNCGPEAIREGRQPSLLWAKVDVCKIWDRPVQPFYRDAHETYRDYNFIYIDVQNTQIK